MIHVRGLTKHYADLRRGKLVALGGDQTSTYRRDKSSASWGRTGLERRPH